MKSLTEIFKGEKGAKVIFAVGIALIIAIFLFSISGEKSKKSQDTVSSEAFVSEIDQYEQKLEERVKEIVSNIQGTGDIHVMITLEKTEENLYGKKDSSVSAVLTPTVKGAVIVCSGSKDAVVKEKVSEAVCKALGISAARVCVTY
ncbi:MAG: hypothetical protein NC203_03390 [Firmicutes bacterium]|nr:hypothetical protein [[Eubacterium] siraeum]MCM1487389.1 hypothetical protein [Bacillota bacterium]